MEEGLLWNHFQWATLVALGLGIQGRCVTHHASPKNGALGLIAIPFWGLNGMRGQQHLPRVGCPIIIHIPHCLSLLTSYLVSCAMTDLFVYAKQPLKPCVSKAVLPANLSKSIPSPFRELIIVKVLPQDNGRHSYYITHSPSAGSSPRTGSGCTVCRLNKPLDCSFPATCFRHNIWRRAFSMA